MLEPERGKILKFIYNTRSKEEQFIYYYSKQFSWNKEHCAKLQNKRLVAGPNTVKYDQIPRKIHPVLTYDRRFKWGIKQENLKYAISFPRLKKGFWLFSVDRDGGFSM